MNIINRNNYEEYFLLYTDNELSAAEKQAVDEFVQQHPDLKVELEMLQQSILQADKHIVFDHKNVLLKNNTPMINEANYEEYFVLYGDDELNNEEKDNVEQFVYRNAQYQAEFELIQQVRLQADRHIVFHDKAVLYRTEKEDEKVFGLHWWKIAAAAIVFIFLSSIGWYIVSKDNTSPTTVKNIPEKKINPPVPEKPQPKQENIVQTKPAVPEVTTRETVNPGQANQKNATAKVPQQEKQEPQKMLTNREDDEKNIQGSNIQLTTTVTQERPKVNIQKMETSGTIALQNTNKAVNETAEPVNEELYAANDEIEILNTTVSKKNKLRGLFRKVSRVVEKTTNIEPGDGGRGIHIANFEIALK